MSRAEPWKIADVIDFEHFLAADQGTTADELRARALSMAAATAKAGSPDRRAVFHAWLQARRTAATEPLPGEIFTAGWQTLLSLAALLGVGIGVSLTAGLLHYRGDEPVNVAWFFAATVGVQVAILFGVLTIWLLRRMTGFFDDFHPLRWLLLSLAWSVSAGLRRLPGAQRERFRATMATLGRRREIYGSLMLWPLLLVTQLFGVCFNLGVLATLLLHVALSDVAFGWQSTLHASPEDAFRLVSILAAPWSVAPHAHPGYEDIVGSRFSYSEGIQPLSRPAMASWWPFLCYAAAFYGLLVRIVLLVWAATSLRGALRGLAFDHPAANALFRRLAGPMMAAQGESSTLHIPTAESPSARAPGGACLVLQATDLILPEATLTSGLAAGFGWQMTRVLPVRIDHPSGNASELEAVAAAAPQLAAIVVAVGARRAPIRAIAFFLQKVAAAAAGREVVVVLVGRGEGAEHAPVKDADFEHWRNFNAIHGLHLGLEKWPAA